MASFSTKTQYDNYTLRLNVNESTPSTANNTSVANWNLYIINGGKRFAISRFHYYVSINGVGVVDKTDACDTRDVEADGGEHFLASGSLTITHENDGTKTIGCYASCSGRSNGYGPGTGELSGNYKLTDIPRQANITSAPNFDDDGNPTVNYSNPAGTAVSQLVLGIYDTNGSAPYVSYRDVSKTGTSYTFNLTDAERDSLRKACTGDSMQLKFYLRTTIGGTNYYSDVTKTFTRKRRINVFSQANNRKLGDPYVYTGGVYKRGIPYVYKNGAWKMGTS